MSAQLPEPTPPSNAALERMRQAALAELARTPVAPPWWRDALALVAINVVVTVACAVALNLDGGHLDRAAPAVLVAAAAPMLLMALAGAAAAVVPPRLWLPGRMLLLAALTGGALVVFGEGTGVGASLWGSGVPCLTAELLMAIIPTVAAVLVLTRFAYNPLRMFVAGLAAGAAGLFALHLHCPIGAPLHLALFHVLPWVAAAALAVVVRRGLRSRSFAP